MRRGRLPFHLHDAAKNEQCHALDGNSVFSCDHGRNRIRNLRMKSSGAKNGPENEVTTNSKLDLSSHVWAGTKVLTKNGAIEPLWHLAWIDYSRCVGALTAAVGGLIEWFSSLGTQGIVGNNGIGRTSFSPMLHGPIGEVKRKE